MFSFFDSRSKLLLFPFFPPVCEKTFAATAENRIQPFPPPIQARAGFVGRVSVLQNGFGPPLFAARADSSRNPFGDGNTGSLRRRQTPSTTSFFYKQLNLLREKEGRFPFSSQFLLPPRLNTQFRVSADHRRFFPLVLEFIKNFPASPCRSSILFSSAPPTSLGRNSGLPPFPSRFPFESSFSVVRSATRTAISFL